MPFYIIEGYLYLPSISDSPCYFEFYFKKTLAAIKFWCQVKNEVKNHQLGKLKGLAKYLLTLYSSSFINVLNGTYFNNHYKYIPKIGFWLSLSRGLDVSVRKHI
jgi:hypothetical protein